tara:strand:- start:329 stop:541 length:213 start_codon:yes stop_codon:yes gene_type:complete
MIGQREVKMRVIGKLRIFGRAMACASKHFFTFSCCRLNTGFTEKYELYRLITSLTVCLDMLRQLVPDLSY